MKNKIKTLGVIALASFLLVGCGPNSEDSTSQDPSTTLVEASLSSLTIESMPTKTTYVEGEVLDLAGLVIKARFSDGSENVVTDYSVDKTSALTLLDTTVTVSYTHKGVTKTASFNITVNERLPITIPVEGEVRYDFDVIAGYGKVENSKVTSKEGVGSYITDFTYGNNSKATLNIYSDTEAQCDMVIKVRKTLSIITLTSQVSVTINGEVLESEAEVGSSVEGNDADFAEVNLGQFYLEQGENEIVITPQSTISNFDFMSVIFYTTKEANLRWTALKDVTGEIFYGIDDHVEISGDYKKILEENTIGCKGYTDSMVNFPIYASRDANAKIYMIQSGMPQINTLTSYYKFTINGERKYSDAQTNYSSVHWGDYKIIEIGTYRIADGLNSIKFEVGTVDWSNSFNIRGIIVETDANVGFEEVDHEAHVCLDICPVCGGCLNDDCIDEACANKCTCDRRVKYTFSSNDSRVQLSEGLIRSRDCIEVIDYNATNQITYNLTSSAAGTGELSFVMSSNPHAQWTFTDYLKTFVNGVQLDKTVYTAKTSQASYDTFVEVVIGDIALLEGANTIQIRYSCAGSYAASIGIGEEGYRFDIKSMSIKSTAVVALSGNEPEAIPTYTFNATDDKVLVNENLNKNVENNYVEVASDYAIENKITFKINASAAGTMKLSFTTSANPMAIWSFVDYFRLWVNATGDLTSDNKVTKGEYKAHTQQGDYSTFVRVDVGEFTLLEGENTIVLGFACAGNAAYRFYVRNMIIATNQTIALI